MADEEAKRQIIEKYDAEAIELNNDEWMSRGSNVRVPESKASHYFIDRKVDAALKLCGTAYHREAEVLEIGCSFGHMTSLLARRFDHLTAVDISPRCIELAAERFQRYGITNTTFQVDDAEQLNQLEDRQFDIIFSFSTIRYCPDLAAALNAVRRRLKPGGIAVIDFPNRYSPWHLFFKTLAGIKPHEHDNLYNLTGLRHSFREAGLEITGASRLLFSTKRLPNALLPLFCAADFLLERIPPFPLLAGIIMTRSVPA